MGQNGSTAPDGFLRRVTARSESGGSVVLATEQATMAEAFANMALTDSVTLRPSTVKSVRLLDGAALVPDKDDKTFTVSLDCVLYDQDGDDASDEDQVKIVGTFSFDAQIMAAIEIDWHQLHKFETSLKTEKEASLQLLANLEWDFDVERQVELAEFRLGAYPVGGVVWIVPTLSVEAHIHGDLTVTFETGITLTETMTNGFGWNEGATDRISSSSSEFQYTPPEFGAEFTFEAGASLNANCLLYGVAGPYVAGKMGLQFGAELGAGLCAQQLDLGLDAVLYAVAGIECDVLDLDFSEQYPLYTRNIGSWSFPLGGTGDLVVNISPEALSPGWTVTGPCDYSLSGNADQVVNDVAVGDYSVAWQTVPGYITPQNQSLTLVQDGQITFNGNYILEEGTGVITVDATPDSVTIPWTLTGPDAYHHNGTNDETIRGLAPGAYHLQWNLVIGYLTPEPQDGSLAAGDTLAFAATYAVDPALGDISVDAAPDSLNAPWSLSGPGGYVHEGQGDEDLTDLVPGDYTVAWGAVEGWIAPAGETVTLPQHGSIVLYGTYEEIIDTGSVSVDVEPDGIGVSWSLYGPAGFSASGADDATFTDMEPGVYSIAYTRPEGYVGPENDQGELIEGGDLVLTAVFVGSGRVEIDANPDELNAPWTLTSTAGFSQSGAGDASLPGMVPGVYTLTWGAVAGYLPPPPQTQQLWDLDWIGFAAVYSRDTTLLIEPVAISPGAFTMGGTYQPSETPHEVTLTTSFQMSRTEITNDQMVSALQYALNHGLVTCNGSTVRDALDGSTVVLLELTGDSRISFADGAFSTSEPDGPATEVSWYGAAAFCDWLSLQAGLPRAYNHGDWSCNGGNPYGASGYRLPTEAEWEYACRAGTATEFSTGDCLDPATEANYDGADPWTGCDAGISLGGPAAVGGYAANPWGLRDMHGNVWEWCNDWWATYGGDATNPAGPATGSEKVLRGGSWFWGGAYARSAFRYLRYATWTDGQIGMRVVRSAS